MPKPLTIRRQELCDEVGCTVHEIKKLVACGLIVPVYAYPGARARYRVKEVEKAFRVKLFTVDNG